MDDVPVARLAAQELAELLEGGQCAVALGRYGAYFEYELSPWDFAAGRLFVEEAGGRVTDARGGPLPLAKSSILASNGPLHDAMLAIIGPRHPGGPG